MQFSLERKEVLGVNLQSLHDVRLGVFFFFFLQSSRNIVFRSGYELQTSEDKLLVAVADRCCTNPSLGLLPHHLH